MSVLHLYDSLVLKRPKLTLLALVAIVAFFAVWTKDFHLDASSDTLLLEHDEDLRYYRKISKRFGRTDFIFITYAPHTELFSKESLNSLKSLREELKKVPRVASVLTLLDVPLLKNPPSTLADLKKNIKTLESPEAKISLAIEEFQDSPIYQELLVSPDLKATALMVNFSREENQELLYRREALRELKLEGKITKAEREELKRVEREYRRQKDQIRQERHEDLALIRKIVESHKQDATIILGGVPMIVDDILSFIKNDLKFFGVGMLILLVITIGVIFKGVRWMVFPLLCCFFSTITMLGLLGMVKWDVTVVSSNFISLQLIFTMSLCIHIIVVYRERLRKNPETENRVLILDAVRHVFVPNLYCTLTTIAGFYSLILCDILPVKHFGWMMSLGLGVTMAMSFLLLPAGFAALNKPPALKEKEFGQAITSALARLTEQHGKAILITSTAIAVTTLVGILRLEVENSFVNYFKKSTEIYQGMKFIDENLGGTTPLDILLEFKQTQPSPAKTAAKSSDKDFAEFAEFEESDLDPSKYWFTPEKLRVIEKVHDYLDGLPEIGKVLSLATLWKTAKNLNGNKEPDHWTTSLLYTATTDKFKKVLVDPYVSVPENQTRLTVRIKDSLATLRRAELLKRIQTDLSSILDPQENSFRLSGIMVLYNNMLQSLFDSQIETIGFTVLALLAMFWILFHSLKIALIALFPNLLSSMTVLGVMGLSHTPLDLMTITIVAISIGIAVDDTIHYIYRFRREISQDWDYLKTMGRCHASIGNAMYYTSLTISIGFAILATSNFIPTILFGLLTALAMIVAMVSNQTLLPYLLITFKPFGQKE